MLQGSLTGYEITRNGNDFDSTRGSAKQPVIKNKMKTISSTNRTLDLNDNSFKSKLHIDLVVFEPYPFFQLAIIRKQSSETRVLRSNRSATPSARPSVSLSTN